jgi:type II secretory pathway pseudopilin PulG
MGALRGIFPRPEDGTSRSRWLREDGYTLFETLIVMVILLVVIAALADGFASATKAQVDQEHRATDQEAARLSLDRMRRDIHCASFANQPVQTTDAGGNPNGYLLNLTETANQCPAVTTGSAGVQWCTIKVGANRYQLYRENSGNCDGTNSTFEEDYITTPNIWTVPSCSAGRFPTVQIDMPINRDPVSRPGRTYELKDEIALRNANLC